MPDTLTSVEKVRRTYCPFCCRETRSTKGNKCFMCGTQRSSKNPKNYIEQTTFKSYGLTFKEEITYIPKAVWQKEKYFNDSRYDLTNIIR